jgi:hypothetical protein
MNQKIDVAANVLGGELLIIPQNAEAHPFPVERRKQGRKKLAKRQELPL